MLNEMKSRLAGKNLALLFIVFLFLHLTTFAQWTQKADMPTARYNARSCTLDGKIYVIGGDSSTTWNGPGIGTMEVYDPALDSWDTTKAPMHTGRVEFGVCVVNGKIYAIGGANTHSSFPFGMVEEYDPVTGLWDTTKTPMPTPRKGAAYGVIDNKIYVAGGSPNSGYIGTSILEIYDPATDTWDPTNAAMLESEYFPNGTVVNDTFYVIGGLIGSPSAGQKVTQIYDPTTDTWLLRAYLNAGRVGHTANEVGGKIYAIGGDSYISPVIHVEEYDPNTDIWTIIDQTPSVITLHTASVFENKIFVFGGSTCVNYPGRCPTSAVYSFITTIPAAPILIEPIGSIDSTEVEFIWTSSYPEIDRYWFEIATDNQFTNSFIDSTITDTTYLYSNLNYGESYWWRVKAYNALGWGEFSDVGSILVVSVEGNENLPTEFSLDQNYPNPFNPTTTINYQIPDLSFVTLKVYDVLGSEVAILVNEEKSIGTYELTWYAESLPSGVYFYQLRAGSLSTSSGQGFVETKKMILLR